MSELIADLPHRVFDAAGDEYYVSVAGEPRPDGEWEGWLEFVPLDESDALLTPTETTQTHRADLQRWADTFTETYVQGAFERALVGSADLPTRIVAQRTVAEVAAEAAIAAVRSEIADPFALYADGRAMMRARLGALSRSTLMQIIREYGLNPAAKSLSWLSHNQLVTFIVTAVEVQEASGRRPQ